MANTTGFKARVEYEVTDGTQKTYTFPFSYLRKKFVMVSILHSDATETALEYGVDYTINDLSVSLTTPAQVGEHLIIYRKTSTDRIITWNDGSILLARDMNTEDAQMLHLQEEQQDYITANAISTKVTSDKEVIWDALNHRISNVSDPKDPQDAVTKHYMENVQGGFVSANTILVQEATKQANAAKASQESAKASQESAKAWAESEGSPNGEDDSLSTTGKTKSAKGWAEQAKSYAGVLNMSFIVDTILPVGIIIEFTNDTDPNELYQGTAWVKMDAGRVLVSAGTYTEGNDTYAYALGDKGGEAKHQSTIDELAAHSHVATCSVNGNHNHGVPNNDNSSGRGQAVDGGASQRQFYTWTTNSGNHTHTVEIKDTGGNQRHENRPPYTVVNRWKRTA